MSVIQPAGELNRRGTLQARGASTDSFGQRVETWSDVVTVWIGIKTISALNPELTAAGAVQNESKLEITMRYRAGVDASMRLLVGPRVLVIHQVVDVEDAHVILKLQCSEGLQVA